MSAHPTPPEGGTEQGNDIEDAISDVLTPWEAPASSQSAHGPEIVHPATGEVLDLAEATTTDLADWRIGLIDLRRALDSLASDLDQEIANRLDYEGKRSARIGAFDIAVDAPTVVAFDVYQLGIELEALVQDGRISRAVAERAIKTEVKRSAVMRECNALLRHADSEVRGAIERVRTENERQRRYVKVARRTTRD
jgi:hypothetical protein